MNKYKRLSLEEREEISRMLAQKFSLRADWAEKLLEMFKNDKINGRRCAPSTKWLSKNRKV